jgi:hypothetical protein
VIFHVILGAVIHRRKAMHKDIIAAVDKEALEAELTSDRLVRCFKGLEVYIVTAQNAPNAMDEIGRIREIEFRKEGGGTAKEKDIDQFDTGKIPYKQLLVWDPVEREIVAMYRYILCRDAVRSDGEIPLATHRLFTFSERFIEEYLPYTIELGRSVVNRNAKKSLYGLYVIWSGLAALVSEYSEMKYFFGKTTTFEYYPARARDLLFSFINLYFGDKEHLVRPREELCYEMTTDKSSLLSIFTGNDYRKDYDRLLKELSNLGQAIPPLIISYLRLTDTIKYFGTAWNPFFGNVMETAFLLTIRDINESKRKKFIETYKSINPDLFN